MKKTGNKIIVIFMVCLIIFDIFLFKNTSYAVDFDLTKLINTVSNLSGGIVSIVLWLLRILVVAIGYLANLLLLLAAKSEGVVDSTIGTSWFISPFDIFFNKFLLLDINFFDIEAAGSKRCLIYKLRTAVSKWYYLMRLLACSILLVVLIYVGIRMALSTLAEDKAKYKKMLIDWIASLCLIFVIHYMIIFVIYGNKAIVGALAKVFDSDDSKSMEDAFTKIVLSSLTGIGIKSMSAVVVFVLITFQTIGFFIAYINRMIKIGFLIMISPLISLTYSIDKMKDGKAQALGNWLKEFIFTVLIQPFHCIMYIAFVKAAFDLVVTPSNPIAAIGELFTSDYNQIASGLLAFFCLIFIKDGEKAVRQIFGFSDDAKDTSFVAGMAVGLTAVNKSKNLGSKMANARNKKQQFRAKHGAAIKQGLGKSAYGQKILNFRANKIDPIKDKIHSIPKISDRANQILDNKLQGHKLMSKVLGATTQDRKNRGQAAKNYMKRNISRATSILSVGMLAASGKADPLMMARVASDTEKNVEGYMENRTTKLSKADAEPIDQGKLSDYAERIEKENKMVSALAPENEAKTVKKIQEYCERDSKIEALEAEIQEMKADPDANEDEIKEKEEQVEELKKPLADDKDGIVLMIYNEDIRKNKDALPKDENGKIIITSENMRGIRLKHQTEITSIRDDMNSSTGKQARQKQAIEKYNRGSEKKRLQQAKDTVESALRDALLRKKYSDSKPKDSSTEVNPAKDDDIQKLSSEDEAQVKALFKSIISGVERDEAVQTTSSSRKKSANRYSNAAIENLGVDDEQSKEQIHSAMQAFIEAQDDSNFADNFRE